MDVSDQTTFSPNPAMLAQAGAPPVEAVIFDRDGVLGEFDLVAIEAFFRPLVPLPVDDIGRRWIQWGQRHGHPQTAAAEDIHWRGFWDALSAELDLSAATRAQLYACNYLRFMHPWADARPALQTARALGLRVGVLTNFALASLDASLVTMGLADLIDVAGTAAVIGAFKPQPAAYLWVTQALQVPPAACILFDDELPGVEGARRLGIEAYLVDRRRDAHAISEGVVCDLTALDTIVRARMQHMQLPF
jgi:putative hydrolase of the HAD superfamily